MKSEIKIISKSVEETITLGNIIGENAVDDLFIAMSGDLGAGKTHFVQGIAKGMKIQDVVTSPTFTIMNYYEGKLPLKHFDFYRLESEYDLYNIGWEEYSVGGVTVVEWSELFPSLIPHGSLCVRIENVSLTERNIFIKWDEKTPENIIKEIKKYALGD